MQQAEKKKKLAASTTVREDVHRRAVILAKYRGVAVTDYLSDLVRPGLARDWEEMVRAEQKRAADADGDSD